MIDTVAFNDETTLDSAGTPHSDQLHVVERYRRVAKNAIEVTLTLTDPKTFTRPWTTKVRLTPASRRIAETLCDSKQQELDIFGHAGGPPLKR